MLDEFGDCALPDPAPLPAWLANAAPAEPDEFDREVIAAMVDAQP